MTKIITMVQKFGTRMIARNNFELNPSIESLNNITAKSKMQETKYKIYKAEFQR